MKISVITVVKNNAATVRDAVESVLSQKNIDLEYIVIDGESTDGTLEILKSYEDRLAVLVSEKDRSLYHAINKGIGLATGDVVAILNSDDLYASDTVLCDIMKEFENESVMMVYGNIRIVDKDDSSKLVRNWVAGKYTRFKLRTGWMPPHPSLVVRRSMYEKYGMFNADLRIAADYDIVLRFFMNGGAASVYLDKTFVYMRTGGASNNTPLNVLKKIEDDLFAAKTNHAGGLFTVLIKRVRKIHQFILPKISRN